MGKNTLKTEMIKAMWEQTWDKDPRHLTKDTSTFITASDSGKGVLHLDRFSGNTSPSQVSKTVQGPVTTPQASGSMHCYCISSHTLKGASGRKQRLQEQTPSWGNRVQTGLYVKTKETIEQYRRNVDLCSALSGSQILSVHTQERTDFIFVQPEGISENCTVIFLPLLTQYKCVLFLLDPLHLPPTQSKTLLHLNSNPFTRQEALQRSMKGWTNKCFHPFHILAAIIKGIIIL